MFAQESVMDIQKENNLIQEAFEVEADEVGFCLDQKWGDYENPYENTDTALAFNLFKKGWLAKAQAVLKWISVKDNLPPANILVLGMSQTRSNIFNIYNVMDLDEFEEADVTHWMPLPDAPQEPAND